MTETATPRPPATREGQSPQDRRSEVKLHLAEGRVHAAVAAARLLLEEQPSVMNQRQLRQLVDGLGPDATVLKPLKVALLASFSIEFIHDALVAHGFANGLRIDIYQPGFGQIRQEILNPQSGLYAFSPDLTVLAIEGDDGLPALYAGFLDADPKATALQEAAENYTQEVANLARSFRRHSSKPLLVHNLALPRKRAGIADLRLPAPQHDLVLGVNRGLTQALAAVVDTYVVDYASLVAQAGARHWYDTRMRLYARAPIAAPMLGTLSREYMKYARALNGLAKKCLVLDLDNTLWGGVIGEDGIDGIQLGPNYPGNAFVEFQRAVLDLYQRGVILAIASKNNAADVDAVFAQHRFMVLKPEHFAAKQVHWEAKAESLRRIARQLSIGLEHMVFADDNPVECEQVRRELPMVAVIHLPKRPELYADALLDEGLFDTLGLSDEDRRRGALYQQRAQAESLRGDGGSIEDYYRSLAMELSIEPVGGATIARAAQLTQKTNQFNVTTCRYTEADLDARKEDPAWLLFTVAVRDKFGDNGIVGVMMAKVAEGRLDIDTLLLSCRVIGRTVETAMLAHLCAAAAERGLQVLGGELRPTAKNAPVLDLFDRHGFGKTAEDAAGNSRWELDLRKAPVHCPDWFRRVP